MSDRGYIWEIVKHDHRDNNKDIHWKQLLSNNQGYSYSTIQRNINFPKLVKAILGF